MSKARIASQVSQTTMGGYAILEKIGDGGMGTVYKGHNPLTNKYVAVKVVTKGVLGNEVLRMRFAQECQVARRLDHPNIVRVLDFGLEGTRPFLVMEYVDGESLGQRIHRQGRLPPDEAVAIIVQIGKALHWAHQRRLVHRDVKPDNILVSNDGVAKLADLGLVKNLEGDLNLTQTQASLGTPNFMSPEQFEDAKHADARSDLYSLAATLYMAVTGELPFGSRSAKAVVTMYKKKVNGELTPPRKLAPEVSERLEAEILRGLDPDRERRHGSAREFVERLSLLIAQPAAAPAPEAPPPHRKGKERRKARFPTKRGTSCQPLQRAPDQSWSGQVVNISEGGLCLELGRRYEPGALLTIVVEGKGMTRRSLVARVMWARPNGPKKYTLGCQFDQPLCDFEVEALR
jgi:eukaryotic-like serine/threonine-protein kinase